LFSSGGVVIAPKLKTAADVFLKADRILLQVTVSLAFLKKQTPRTRQGA